MSFDFGHTPDHCRNGSYRWNAPGMSEDMIGMGTADLDYFCAPCIREALMSIAEENCYNYRQRSNEYYDAVIDWYQRNYQLEVRKEWLSNVPSTIGAVRIALEIYGGPGCSVIVQSPVFAPVVNAVKGADCTLIENPLKLVEGNFEIDFEDFENKVEKYRPKIFLMVNPNNPTGKVYTAEELERLVEICDRYQVKIVSDEVHCLILHDGHEHIPILAVNETARRISVQIVSLSKGYNIMSLPHAIITIADETMQRQWKRQMQAYSFDYAANSFAVAAVTSIMKGEADEWMKDLTAYLEKNLDECIAFIREKNLPLVPFRPEAGFLLWIDCRDAQLPEGNLADFFREQAQIDLDDGEENFGPEGRGFIRINFAVTNQTLKEALKRIEAVFRR